MTRFMKTVLIGELIQHSLETKFGLIYGLMQVLYCDDITFVEKGYTTMMSKKFVKSSLSV